MGLKWPHILIQIHLLFNSQIANRLLPPLIAMAVLIVAFAEMFYTRFQGDCLTDDDNGYSGQQITAPVCTVRDSYRAVYQLLRGENSLVLTGNGTDGTVESNGAITMTFFLLVCFITFLVAFLVAIFMAASSLSIEDIERTYFWEPKFAFVLSTINDAVDKPKRWGGVGVVGGLPRKSEKLWDALMCSIRGADVGRRKDWYSKTSRVYRIIKLPFFGTLIALIVIPIWFSIGLVSLGLLWPPQIRRAVFRPQLGGSGNRRQTDLSCHSQVNELRKELLQLKLMSLDRSDVVEQEIREIKQILFVAMHED